MASELIINVSTTGLNINSDRVIEIGLNLNGSMEVVTVNPGIPISEGARPHIKLSDDDILSCKPLSYWNNKKIVLNKIAKAETLIFLNQFHYHIFLNELERHFYDDTDLAFDEPLPCFENKKIVILTKVYGDKMNIRDDEQKFITMNKMVCAALNQSLSNDEIDSKIEEMVDSVLFKTHPKIVSNNIQGFWVTENLLGGGEKKKAQKRRKTRAFSTIEKRILNSSNTLNDGPTHSLGFNL